MINIRIQEITMSSFLTKFLREKANEAINKVDEPFRSGLNNILGPTGFGDSARSFNDKNSFSSFINTKIADSSREAALLASSNPNILQSAVLNNAYDWRARLRPKKQGETLFYAEGASVENSDHLLRPIQKSGGLVWQYTPQIFIAGSADYSSSNFQGQNYSINTFNNSSVPEITVNSTFTANDAYEARYLLAIMIFLRVAHKAYYGSQDVPSGLAGTPPPVLLFEYLGEHGFNKVPVVMTNYTLSLAPDIDYVPVVVNDNVTYVPTTTDIMVALRPQYTPHKLRNNFNLHDVANGSLYKGGYV